MDDLDIKQLRIAAHWDGHGDLMEKAADHIEKLETALKTYGWHLAGCPAHDASVCEECTCGFDEVLKDET